MKLPWNKQKEANVPDGGFIPYLTESERLAMANAASAEARERIEAMAARQRDLEKDAARWDDIAKYRIGLEFSFDTWRATFTRSTANQHVYHTFKSKDLRHAVDVAIAEAQR